MAKPHGLESMRLIFDTIIISRVCALKALSLPVQIGTKSEVSLSVRIVVKEVNMFCGII